MIFYKLSTQVKSPKYGTSDSACFDLCAFLPNGDEICYYGTTGKDTLISVSGTITIPSNARVLVPTGLIFALNRGTSLRLYARSGLSLKSGLVLANSVGIVDADYRDEVMVILHNIGDSPALISDGDRICQGEVIYTATDTILQETFLTPERMERTGGFGSTGRN